MVLVEDGYTFKDLVNMAYKEIKDAVTKGDFNLIDDFYIEINYSEICYWCGFPDLQTSQSIYERAINVATMMVMVDQGIEFPVIKDFIKDNISNLDSEPITQKYESYSNGDTMALFINDKQVNIPKEFYNAIKNNDL